ncbi:hypothetical protein MLD38_012236 [Melastoma candidum]|uniref:Uncharacterized protein n=1 Tax=Melastoma candidum TaxID=119954 RepID=A0ACB9R550_9MYRT|nr:hypothetical protein MLD38_012236 [Melastoma candidum]
MGNYKFRLSDMIPSTWLRKLNHYNATSSIRKSLLPPGDNSGHELPQENPEPTPPRSPSPIDHAPPRKSYHFSRKVQAVQPIRPLAPPRRSASKPRRSVSLGRPNRRSSPRLVRTSVSAHCSCRAFASFHLARAKPRYPILASPPDSPSSTDAIFPQSPPSFGGGHRSVPSSESFTRKVSRSNNSSSCRCKTNFDCLAMLAQRLDRYPLLELELPPVITNPPKINETAKSLRKGGENRKPVVVTNNDRNSGSRPHSSTSILVKSMKEETRSRMARADNEKKKLHPLVNLATSPASGLRLRVNSPKVGSRKQSQPHSHPQKRKSANASPLSRPLTNPNPRTSTSSGATEGFAVVKSSSDPWKDFRESMVEMIVENDIRESKELEDLLASYLALNSEEYHGIIVEVFKEIWFGYGQRAPSK